MKLTEKRRACLELLEQYRLDMSVTNSRVSNPWADNIGFSNSVIRGLEKLGYVTTWKSSRRNTSRLAYANKVAITDAGRAALKDCAK